MSPNLSSEASPLAVIGTVAVDQIKTPFGARERVFGGSGSYFSYAASFFTRVALVGVVGEDFPGEYRDILAERPIDLSHLEVLPGKTFCWKGFYEHDMNAAQTLETHLNVLAEFNPTLRFSSPPPYVFLANVDPDLQGRVLDQLEKPRLRFVALDTMNYWIASKRESLLRVLARVDAVVLNDGEARQLTGETNLIKAGQIIRGLGPNFVIIKKGEHGALVLGDNQFFALPAYPLDSVFDPTGAGDSFAGGMMGCLTASGEISFDSLKKAVAFGSVVASFTVEDFGLDSLRRTSLRQIEERLSLFRRLTLF